MFILYDKPTGKILSYDDNGDFVVGKNQALLKIPGRMRDYPLIRQGKHLSKYAKVVNGKIVKRSLKEIEVEDEGLSRKHLAEKLIRQKLREIAIRELKKEGKWILKGSKNGA